MAYRITESCLCCGACVSTCPVEAIQEGSPSYIITEACVECGACAAVCPAGAIEAP